MSINHCSHHWTVETGSSTDVPVTINPYRMCRICGDHAPACHGIVYGSGYFPRNTNCLNRGTREGEPSATVHRTDDLPYMYCHLHHPAAVRRRADLAAVAAKAKWAAARELSRFGTDTVEAYSILRDLCTAEQADLPSLVARALVEVAKRDGTT